MSNLCTSCTRLLEEPSELEVGICNRCQNEDLDLSGRDPTEPLNFSSEPYWGVRDINNEEHTDALEEISTDEGC